MAKEMEIKMSNIKIDATNKEHNLDSKKNKGARIEAKDIKVWYDNFNAIKGINMEIKPNSVTAFIGPSGCGKSTFLRLFNRMNDYIDGFKVEGKIKINGNDIYHKKVNVEELRKEVGMVFQKPNPFPKSIFENVAYGLKIQGINDKKFINERVEKALRQADLWEEVKENLKKSALTLSGGQQQRLCIARTLAVEPSIILMDEPTSALDPISTAKIEDLIFSLKEKYTVIIVTHNMQQASRISDYTAFFYMGELIEFDKTKTIFTNPAEKQTENYITGRFG
jgi:phosphate transport system ATP-binding protein